MPTRTPSNGLETANQNETFQPESCAIRFVFTLFSQAFEQGHFTKCEILSACLECSRAIRAMPSCYQPTIRAQRYAAIRQTSGLSIVNPTAMLETKGPVKCLSVEIGTRSKRNFHCPESNAGLRSTRCAKSSCYLSQGLEGRHFKDVNRLGTWPASTDKHYSPLAATSRSALRCSCTNRCVRSLVQSRLTPESTTKSR